MNVKFLIPIIIFKKLNLSLICIFWCVLWSLWGLTRGYAFCIFHSDGNRKRKLDYNACGYNHHSIWCTYQITKPFNNVMFYGYTHSTNIKFLLFNDLTLEISYLICLLNAARLDSLIPTNDSFQFTLDFHFSFCVFCRHRFNLH